MRVSVGRDFGSVGCDDRWDRLVDLIVHDSVLVANQ